MRLPVFGCTRDNLEKSLEVSHINTFRLNPLNQPISVHRSNSSAFGFGCACSISFFEVKYVAKWIMWNLNREHAWKKAPIHVYINKNVYCINRNQLTHRNTDHFGQFKCIHKDRRKHFELLWNFVGSDVVGPKPISISFRSIDSFLLHLLIFNGFSFPLMQTAGKSVLPGV